MIAYSHEDDVSTSHQLRLLCPNLGGRTYSTPSPEFGDSAGHLNTEQTQQWVAHLSDITYLHSHQIVACIQKTWKMSYSVSGLNKWLHQNGFSDKQPKGMPISLMSKSKMRLLK
jgi:transposase